MAFDFPTSPTTGQTYAPSGGPTYTYDGTVWKVLTPGSGFQRTTFTATSGQTTFSLTYTVNAIDVYRNGVKLNGADFTATNGTSVVLANGCTVGDTVEIISYPQIVYTNALLRTGDTMTGNLLMSGNVIAGGNSSAATLNLTGGSTFNTDGASIAIRGSTAGYNNQGMEFYAGGSERVRIDSSGNLILTAAGNITLNHLNTYSAATSGYQKLPSGLIIQWGVSGSIGDATITFPIAFPNNCYTVTATSNSNGWVIINTTSKTGVGIIQRTNLSGYAAATGSIYWMAVGN